MKRKYIRSKSRAIELDFKALLSLSDVQVKSSDGDDRLDDLIIDKEGTSKADNTWDIF